MHEARGASPKSLFATMGAAEAVTGLVLLVAPSALVGLLLGAEPGTPAGVTVGRLAGVAMFTLGAACWFAREDSAGRAAKGLIAAMVLYHVGVIISLVLSWTNLGLIGIAFWPVVMGHIVMAAWCILCLARTHNESLS